MMDKSVVRLEVEYEDGEVRRAVGEDAHTLWTVLNQASEFYHVRQKRTYEGPVLQVVNGPKSKMEALWSNLKDLTRTPPEAAL